MTEKLTCPKCNGEMTWQKEGYIISVEGWSKCENGMAEATLDAKVKRCKRCDHIEDREGRTPKQIEHSFKKLLMLET